MRTPKVWNLAWAASGVGFVVLFGGGLVVADLLAVSWYPDVGDSDRHIERYFTESAGNARGLAFFHALAALLLLAYAGYVHRAVSAQPPGTLGLGALALAGATMAAAFLLLSALLFATLTLPDAAADPRLARTLLLLSYMAGGPAITLPLAVFIAATSISVRDAGPRWLERSGAIAAVLGLLSSVVLLVEALGTGDQGEGIFVVGLLALLAGFGWVALSSLALAWRARAAP